jgi:DNA ligase (NAD+)
LDRMGEKSAQNLLQAIEESKKRGLAALIFALGIRHVGVKAGRVLAKRYKTLENLQKATVDDLKAIEDIGEIMALSIVSFLRDQANTNFLERLKKAGVKMSEEKTVKTQLLAGKSIVVTGTLKRWNRREIEGLIEQLGGKTSSGVSKKTTFVLYGEKPGSKLAKAQELGIQILNEEEFAKLIDQ